MATQAQIEQQRPHVPKRAPVKDTSLAGKLVRHVGSYKTTIDTLRVALANAESELAARLASTRTRPFLRSTPRRRRLPRNAAARASLTTSAREGSCLPPSRAQRERSRTLGGCGLYLAYSSMTSRGPATRSSPRPSASCPWTGRRAPRERSRYSDAARVSRDLRRPTVSLLRRTPSVSTGCARLPGMIRESANATGGHLAPRAVVRVGHSQIL